MNEQGYITATEHGLSILSSYMKRRKEMAESSIKSISCGEETEVFAVSFEGGGKKCEYAIGDEILIEGKTGKIETITVWRVDGDEMVVSVKARDISEPEQLSFTISTDK